MSNSEGYTEDWAVIEINASKVTADNFIGNVIDLGVDISVPELTHKMRFRNIHSFTPGQTLTAGRANGISYIRIYYDDRNAKTSIEWAILLFDSSPVHAEGDSGSVIIDRRRRIGSAGATLFSDVTYAMSIGFLLSGSGTTDSAGPTSLPTHSPQEDTPQHITVLVVSCGNPETIS
ncbi:hypothetical protein EDD18DRAFT_1354224 [Armillaria luteobubalina]|uniref:Uncharacterized protein n=1 Tax=Armillaria luteobubalina TaxID=153913 RepID=A0AA39UWE2_9AGAR|nr:hypothetical protein EDD18DRAFT_1354224 [Armillaria luteobubalina]